MARDAPDNAAGSRPAASLGWRDAFSDPELLALIETALDSNRDLRLAVLRVEEARARYGVQRAGLFPSLEAAAQGARAGLPGGLAPGGEPAVNAEYRVQLGLNQWELDLWGRVRNLGEAALQDYLATEAAQRAARLALIAEVAHAYTALRELDERLSAARQTEASREAAFRIFSRRHEVGSASRLELSQVESLWLQARDLSAQLAQSRASQAHALSQLDGASVALAPAEEIGLESSPLPVLAAGLPSQLLTARPDIIAAEHRLRAANANIGAARAAFFPRITLTGALGEASAELNGLFGGAGRAWSFLPAVSLPLFDGGRRRAELDLSELRRDMAVAEYEKTIQTAFREVADALSARHWLRQQVDIQRTALSARSERARLAQLRYESGAAAYLEVLDAQRELLEGQQQLIQVRSRLRASQIALYAALGGGSLDAVPASPPSSYRDARP